MQWHSWTFVKSWASNRSLLGYLLKYGNKIPSWLQRSPTCIELLVLCSAQSYQSSWKYFLNYFSSSYFASNSVWIVLKCYSFRGIIHEVKYHQKQFFFLFKINFLFCEKGVQLAVLTAGKGCNWYPSIWITYICCTDLGWERANFLHSTFMGLCSGFVLETVSLVWTDKTLTLFPTVILNLSQF